LLKYFQKWHCKFKTPCSDFQILPVDAVIFFEAAKWLEWAFDKGFAGNERMGDVLVFAGLIFARAPSRRSCPVLSFFFSLHVLFP
jgi:hypothetical protein